MYSRSILKIYLYLSMITQIIKCTHSQVNLIVVVLVVINTIMFVLIIIILLNLLFLNSTLYSGSLTRPAVYILGIEFELLLLPTGVWYIIAASLRLMSSILISLKSDLRVSRDSSDSLIALKIELVKNSACFYI